MLLNNNLSAEYYMYDFEDTCKGDYHRLDLTNWSSEWGVVCHLIAEEIRFSHYLHEIKILNTSCGFKMSKFLSQKGAIKYLDYCTQTFLKRYCYSELKNRFTRAA